VWKHAGITYEPTRPERISNDTIKSNTVLATKSTNEEFIPIESLGFVKLVRDYVYNRVAIQVVQKDRQTPHKHFSQLRLLLLPENEKDIRVPCKPIRNTDGEIFFIVNHHHIAQITNEKLYLSFFDLPNEKDFTTSFELGFEN
jgi:hypothetical protein